MYAKPKPAAQPVEKVKQQLVENKQAPAAPVPTAVPSSTPTTASVDQNAATFASLATGSEYDSAVANLVEMGFVREDVIAAMRAAFNNPGIK